MEKLGIPSTVICTERFMEQGQTMMEVHGLRDLPIIKVFHPIATASTQALQKEADRVAEEAAANLATDIRID